MKQYKSQKNMKTRKIFNFKQIKIKKYEKDCLCIFCSEEIQEDTGIRIGKKHICPNCASKIEEKIAK